MPDAHLSQPPLDFAELRVRPDPNFVVPQESDNKPYGTTAGQTPIHTREHTREHHLPAPKPRPWHVTRSRVVMKQLGCAIILRDCPAGLGLLQQMPQRSQKVGCDEYDENNEEFKNRALAHLIPDEGK